MDQAVVRGLRLRHRLNKEKFLRDKINIGLLILMMLVLGLSMWGQPDNPPGFFRDEAGIGYSAYSILKTGRDTWGRLMPLHFKALGDFPPGMYNYLTVPFVAVMGLTELATRMAGIVAAVLLIPLLYKFLNTIHRNRKLSLLVVTVFVSSPWFLVQARSGSEPLVAMVWVTLGLLAWRQWLLNSEKRFLIGMILSYFLAIFTYNAVKPILFLIHALYSWYLFPDKITKPWVWGSSLLILLVSFVSVFAIAGAEINFESGNIFKKVAEDGFIVEFTREGLEKVPVIVSRMFHNKLVNLGLTATGAMLNYLDGQFLFFHGGLPDRYQIPYVGNLLLITLPFLILGVTSRKGLSDRTLFFWLVWLLIGILPGVVSINFHPHVKRVFFMFLPLAVLTAVGIMEAWEWVRKKWLFLAAIFGLFVFNYAFFLNAYFVHSRYVTANARSFGYKQGFESLKELESEYDRIKVYGEFDYPEIFYMFYNRLDPRQVQAKADVRNNLFDEVEGAWSLNNYEFIEKNCPSSTQLETGVLYMTREVCVDLLPKKAYRMRNLITMPDKAPRLMIFEAEKSYLESLVD